MPMHFFHTQKSNILRMVCKQMDEIINKWKKAEDITFYGKI